MSREVIAKKCFFWAMTQMDVLWSEKVKAHFPPAERMSIMPETYRAERRSHRLCQLAHSLRTPSVAC